MVSLIPHGIIDARHKKDAQRKKIAEKAEHVARTNIVTNNTYLVAEFRKLHPNMIDHDGNRLTPYVYWDENIFIGLSEVKHYTRVHHTDSVYHPDHDDYRYSGDSDHLEIYDSKRQKVFEARGPYSWQVIHYIPGPWTRHLDDVYRQIGE